MNVEKEQNPHEMRDVWSWGLSWLARSTTAIERRNKQREITKAIHEHLKRIDSMEALDDLYARDSRWCIYVARTLYPNDWESLGVHATSSAAFGIRYVELATGKDIDARNNLPKWIGEWAVW